VSTSCVEIAEAEGATSEAGKDGAFFDEGAGIGDPMITS
jgi:hypothetical protein